MHTHTQTHTLPPYPPLPPTQIHTKKRRCSKGMLEEGTGFERAHVRRHACICTHKRIPCPLTPPPDTDIHQKGGGVARGCWKKACGESCMAKSIDCSTAAWQVGCQDSCMCHGCLREILQSEQRCQNEESKELRRKRQQLDAFPSSLCRAWS